MTLSRQLLAMLVLLFVLMFIGTFLISVDNTRDYLGKQLESHAQDTATSLGLSLSPAIADQDQAMIQSMVDAIFDRGYYQLIRVRDNLGQTVYERRNPLRLDHAPDWFIRLIPLATPTANALLMSGWNQAGTLEVISHPGYAYDELWQGAFATLLWFAGCAAFSLLLGFLLLRLLLKPLRAIEEVAIAICNQEFPIQEHLPWTRELRQVVQAMNRMTERVGLRFREQAEIAEQLQREAHMDPVTELGNRRHFVAQASHWLNTPDEFSQGALLLLQLRKFREFNDRFGFAAGDELLRQTAAILPTTCPDSSPLFCRLSGADFAIMANGITAEEATTLARNVLAALRHLQAAGLTDAEDIAHLGVALCKSGETVTDVLALADQALRTAQQQGPNQYHVMTRPDHAGIRLGASEWRERLRDYLAQDRLIAHFQPVVNTANHGQRLHYELLLRASETEDALLPAGIFIPLAERTGLAQAIDRRAVELAVTSPAMQRPHPETVAVNLSPSSINDPGFVDWLEQYLSTSRASRHLVFEIPEYMALQQLDAVRAFSLRLKPLGSGLALDHFGRGLASFAYLHTLKVRYLKVDGTYIRGIDRDKDNQFFVRALAMTAHEIDVKIIAETVETQAEAEQLRGLYVDAFQGYLIGRPGPFPH